MTSTIQYWFVCQSETLSSKQGLWLSKQGPILSWKGLFGTAMGLVFRFQGLWFEFCGLLLRFQGLHQPLDRLGSYLACLTTTNKPGLECKEEAARRNMFMYGVDRYSEKGEVYLQQQRNPEFQNETPKQMQIVISGPWA